MTLRIGTRGSVMALAQTRFAAKLIAERLGVTCEEVILDTSGDLDQSSKLSAMGGKGGAFVARIRQAMRDGSIDIAMHSLKDIPGNDEYDRISEEFVIGAFLTRDDPRDCLVLRKGPADENTSSPAVIGTTSARRTAFLRRLMPAAKIINFRGAADTRIRKLDDGVRQQLTYSKLDASASEPAADALVLAKSGLERIGYGARVSRVFSVDEMCPALGQGVVVLEYRRDRTELRGKLGAISDERTSLACRAERALLRGLNGHCNSPIAGLCRLVDGELQLRGVVMRPDGSEFLEVNLSTSTETPERLGESAARRLIRNGAERIIEETRYL